MIVFSHDHRFFVKDSGVYSTGGLPSQVWARYKEVFGTVEVVGRKFSLECDGEPAGVLSSSENVRFNLYDSISNVSALISPPYFIRKSLMDLIKQSDGVIARLPSELGFLCIDIASKLNKPWAVELVECPWDALWNLGSLKGKVYAPVQYLRTRRALKNSEFSLYVTKQFLQSRYPNHKVNVSCSNVELQRVSDAVLASRILKINTAASGKNFKVGLIGSLDSKIKGIDVAIKAIQYLRVKGVNVSLHILGKGDAEKLKLGLSPEEMSAVSFEGFIAEKQGVYDWLDDIDLYIQPSRNEGLPRALIEAMSRGCPCVGSNVAGIPELLDSKCISKKGNVRDLADRINSLISDPDSMVEQANLNFLTAKNYYSDRLDKIRFNFWSKFQEHTNVRPR